MSLRTSLADRLRAGGLHLGLSVAVALCAMALIFLGWYPPPLAEAQGVSRLLLILIAVDVAVGPMITVLIFDRAKKSLRFDLAVVGVCQLAFLLYGLQAIYTGRPAVIVFNVDRFDVVQAQDVDRSSLARAKEAGMPGLPLWRPRFVYAKLPADAQRRRPDLPHMAEWYEPYESGRETVIGRLRPLDELQSINRLEEREWGAFLDALGQPPAELGYLPLRARVRDGAVIVDRATAEIRRIVLLQPRW
jgi:hypothetical protein